MKRFLCLLLALLFVFSVCACGETEKPESVSSDTSIPETQQPDPNAATVWTDACADTEAGLRDASDVYTLEYFRNGVTAQPANETGENDVRLLLHGKQATRYVNPPEGYAVTYPEPTVAIDLSLGAYRTQLRSESGVLTLTRETENPYDDSIEGWNIFLEEWLEAYLVDLSYLAANRLRYTRKPTVSTDILPGYEVRTYSITVIQPGKMRGEEFYEVAIIRKVDVYKTCFLMMYRSGKNQNELFDSVIRSFKEIPLSGTPVCTQGQYELQIPDYWNGETAAYYEKLCTQKGIDWGFFTRSMVDASDDSYQHQCETLTESQQFLAEETDYTPDIMPTYSEMTFADQFKPFPTEMANTYAGGTGFNGKPVLQYTFHMAALYSSRGEVAELFNVLRGTHDADLRKLAQDIKAYGHPVLFRLNNEMNGGWTCYNCQYTMLDADLFVQAWRYLYDLFREEGVDNCIWIWNPVAVDAPYGNFNEHLLYFPGSEYVQLIGLTDYEMNNESVMVSFRERYSALYEKNLPYFDAFPWVIGEFGCAAGGERKINWDTGNYDETVLGRNRIKQSQWVKEMFSCLNDKEKDTNAFCEKIKAIVWFSANDYVDIDGTEYITNYIQLDENVPETLEQLRIGLAKNRERKEA